MSDFISINRVKPFDPSFAADGLSGNFTIAWQDQRSLGFLEIDLGEIALWQGLKEGEAFVGGELLVLRLRARQFVAPDAKIFFTLWNYQRFIPQEWTEILPGMPEGQNKSPRIFFAGTILLDDYQRRSILCIYWCAGHWCFRCIPLNTVFTKNDFFAVLQDF